MRQQGLCLKLINLTTSILFLKLCISASNTSHSVQNFNCLLQFHLWNSLSLSVRSPSTLCSSKTIRIRIRRPSFCLPLRKHRNIWRKIVFLRWSVCLEQFVSQTLCHSDSFSFFKTVLKTRLFNNYL